MDEQHCRVCQGEQAPAAHCRHCGWPQEPAAQLVWAQNLWAQQRQQQDLTAQLAQMQEQLTEILARLPQAAVLEGEPEPTVKPEPPPTVDYGKLRQLLQDQQWQAADWLTAELMIALVKPPGVGKSGFLTETELDRFPGRELRAINRLWLSASQGRFGLTVQKQKTFAFERNRFAIAQIWPELGSQLGWYRGDRWLTYAELEFSLDAPPGHLPVLGDGLIWFISGWGGSSHSFAALMSRVDKSGL